MTKFDALTIFSFFLLVTAFALIKMASHKTRFNHGFKRLDEIDDKLISDDSIPYQRYGTYRIYNRGNYDRF